MSTDLPGSTSSATLIRNFEAKLRLGCARCGLDGWRGPLLVGFSGGGDSTALLLALSSLTSGRGRWPSSLIAVHVNHGLRAEMAERDALHAESFCRTHEIPFRRMNVRTEDISGRGLEAAARDVRRAAFLEAARETGARAVALAHTLDDQAETVLMRLLEGAGVRGLTGMRPRAQLVEEFEPGDLPPIDVLRPMLEVSRAEGRAYLKARGAGWVEDETNTDERRLRNRVRRLVLPAVEEILGKSVAGRIAASSDHLAAAYDVLKGEIRQAQKRFLSKEDGDIQVGPLPEVSRLPQAVRAGLWEVALKTVYRTGAESRKRMPQERLLLMIDRLALEGGPSSSLNLPGGLEARRNYDAIFFGRKRERHRPPEGEVPLIFPGRTVHPHLNVVIEATPADQFHGEKDGTMTVILNADGLQSGPVLRSRREGDRFHPVGCPGEKKLKEFFIDRKVPRPDRDFVPLVATGNEVIWTVGQSVSEKYAAGLDSRKGIVLQAVILPENSGDSPEKYLFSKE